MKNKKSVKIYCDGACHGNPGKAGSGLAIYHGEDLPTLFFGGYEETGTNNSAELKALYVALTMAKKASAKEVTEVEILSDSKYSIDCITKWAYGWRDKGWKKKGGEIKNLELIKVMHALYDEIKDTVSIGYVKGHAGIEGNELADRMAGMAIKRRSESFGSFAYVEKHAVLAM